MKSWRRELIMELPKRRGFVNITGKVSEALKESGIREGLLLCNAMHITASVFINDDESGLHADFESGWKGWRRKNHIANIRIMAMKTMPMPT